MVKLTLVPDPGDVQDDLGTLNLTSSVYQTLRADLVAGTFQPGGRLGIRNLQERYGCGATPIREVLNRLSAEGFVRQIDQKGFRVPTFSRKELADLVRARCLLNEVVLREAIGAATDATDEAMIVAHFRLSRIPQMIGSESGVLNPDVEEAHKLFHQTVIAPCGSAWLIGFHERLFDMTTRYRVLTAPKQNHPHDDHREIMEAVLDRNVAHAIECSNVHIQRVASLTLEMSD